MFGVSWTEYLWISNPKGPKISRFLQEVKGQTDDFKNLSCETLYISDYEYVNISTFALSDIKLWLACVPDHNGIELWSGTQAIELKQRNKQDPWVFCCSQNGSLPRKRNLFHLYGVNIWTNAQSFLKICGFSTHLSDLQVGKALWERLWKWGSCKSRFQNQAPSMISEMAVEGEYICSFALICLHFKTYWNV